MISCQHFFTLLYTEFETKKNNASSLKHESLLEFWKFLTSKQKIFRKKARNRLYRYFIFNFSIFLNIYSRS